VRGLINSFFKQASVSAVSMGLIATEKRKRTNMTQENPKPMKKSTNGFEWLISSALVVCLSLIAISLTLANSPIPLGHLHISDKAVNGLTIALVPVWFSGLILQPLLQRALDAQSRKLFILQCYLQAAVSQCDPPTFNLMSIRLLLKSVKLYLRLLGVSFTCGTVEAPVIKSGKSPSFDLPLSAAVAATFDELDVQVQASSWWAEALANMIQAQMMVLAFFIMCAMPFFDSSYSSAIGVMFYASLLTACYIASYSVVALLWRCKSRYCAG